MELLTLDSDRPERFRATPIDEMLALDRDGVPLATEDDEGGAVAWLLACGGTGSRCLAVLLAMPGQVRVNGVAALPVTVLRRGDALSIGPARLFYSDDGPARSEAFDPRDHASTDCARCRGPIGPGDPVVVCPTCGTVYMAHPDRAPNCWTIGPCVVCGRDPQAERAWRPPVSRARGTWRQDRRTIGLSTRDEANHV